MKEGLYLWVKEDYSADSLIRKNSNLKFIKSLCLHEPKHFLDIQQPLSTALHQVSTRTNSEAVVCLLDKDSFSTLRGPVAAGSTSGRSFLWQTKKEGGNSSHKRFARKAVYARLAPQFTGSSLDTYRSRRKISPPLRICPLPIRFACSFIAPSCTWARAIGQIETILGFVFYIPTRDKKVEEMEWVTKKG